MPDYKNEALTTQTENHVLINRIDEVLDLAPYILPEERVVDVQHPDMFIPERHPSALKAIMLLTGANQPNAIGEKGPSLAALSNPENEHIAELRKFEALFGRDSLRVANELADYYPKLLQTTILSLAELQGIGNSSASEEEPGRIIHEHRKYDDPVREHLTETEGWGWPYYGEIDATPVFISSIAKAYQTQPDFLQRKFVGRDGEERTVFQAFQSALGWLETRLESNPQGLLEFKSRNGISNQVWKDSGDSYIHKDGTMANHDQGIASVEAQALGYDALMDGAGILNGLALATEDVEVKDYYQTFSHRLEARANKLKKQFLDNFWEEDERGGYFVLGTDRDENGELRKIAVRSSNMGHLLNSRILDGDEPDINYKREEVIRCLLSSEMLNASGIRTLSNKEKAYRPGAYHNGSVWLWDTSICADGLARHGYFGLAFELKRRVWGAVNLTKRFPEFVRGGDDQQPTLNTRIVDVWDDVHSRINRIEQPPQEIQAWTVAAILSSKFRWQPLNRSRSMPTKAVDSTKQKLELDLLSNI